MRFVIVNWMDSCGNMYNLATSINKYTKHEAVSINCYVNPPGQFPCMVLADTNNLDEVHELIDKADVIVVKEYYFVLEHLGINAYEFNDRPLVVIFGGAGYRRKTNFERNVKFFNIIRDDTIWATSSIDFLENNPDWCWVPASIRLDELREKYDRTKLDPPLVFTSPSASTDGLTGTIEKFNEVVRRLKNKGKIFSSKVLYGDTPNVECLKMKAHASIFFDRIYDIYGMNSQEAGAFESVVITGYSDFVDWALRSRGYNCPFIRVRNENELYGAMKNALDWSPLIRERNGQQCFEYVKEVHSGELAANQLVVAVE